MLLTSSSELAPAIIYLPFFYKVTWRKFPLTSILINKAGYDSGSYSLRGTSISVYALVRSISFGNFPVATTLTIFGLIPFLIYFI